MAGDNDVGLSTAYRSLHEGITLLAACQPALHSALLAAKIAGHFHVNLDGTLIYTDRSATPGSSMIGQIAAAALVLAARRARPDHVVTQRYRHLLTKASVPEFATARSAFQLGLGTPIT